MFDKYEASYENWVRQFKNKKDRSIQELHALYLKAKERQVKRNKEKSDFLNFILSDVEGKVEHQMGDTKRTNYKIYKKEEDGYWELTLMNKENEVRVPDGVWTSGWRKCKFSSREKRLNFLLKDDLDKLVEYGEKYDQFSYMCKNVFASLVWKEFLKKCKETLNDKFSESDKKFTQVATIKFGDTTYVFEYDPNEYGFEYRGIIGMNIEY